MYKVVDRQKRKTMEDGFAKREEAKKLRNELNSKWHKEIPPDYEGEPEKFQQWLRVHGKARYFVTRGAAHPKGEVK